LRRYDVDWLRVLALGLLIIYHSVVSFQPWGHLIAFPVNKDALEYLWIIMAAMNIWRIPILFIISGMGLGFAIKRRNWKMLLKDRSIRILVPYIFGFLAIGPLNLVLSFIFYGDNALVYIPNPGHLWFLGNIYFYVLITLAGLVYLYNKPNNVLLRFLEAAFKKPFGIYILALPFLLEAWIVAPKDYPSYADTEHGFWLGLICFICGFIFIALKDIFWIAVERVRRWAIGAAILLYIVRFLLFELEGPSILIAVESFNWMIGILGFSSRYLNKQSKLLQYLSRAVYPVYIIHMPIQFLASIYIFDLHIPAILKLITLILSTVGGSLLIYHFLLSRIGTIGILFGIIQTKQN